MNAQAAADQEQVVEARTPRPHPVPRSIERDAKTTCEGEVVGTVMALGESGNLAHEVRRSRGRRTVSDGGHDVGTDLGLPPGSGTDPRDRGAGTARARAATTPGEIIPAPRTEADRRIARKPGLRTPAPAARLAQRTTVQRTPHRRGQEPQQRIPALAVLAAHLAIARGAPAPTQRQDTPGRQRLAQSPQGEPVEVGLQRQPFERRRNRAGRRAHAIEPRAATPEHGISTEAAN